MKITYLQLLKLVEQGKQPKTIRYDHRFYEWDGCEYVCECGDGWYRLSDKLGNYTTKAQTTAEFIEVVQEVLTDEEKAYLSAVTKPFKKDVSKIMKFEYQGWEYIRIVLRYDSINFPIFAKGKMYKGMEKAREYTLEELGL